MTESFKDRAKGYGRGNSGSRIGGAPINTGRVAGNDGPGGAVNELYKQHPHDYNEFGPWHGTDDHYLHRTPVRPNTKHPYGDDK